jgi:hypothetical protein
MTERASGALGTNDYAVSLMDLGVEHGLSAGDALGGSGKSAQGRLDGVESSRLGATRSNFNCEAVLPQTRPEVLAWNSLRSILRWITFDLN